MPKGQRKTIAVTGASGYIAGRLIEALAADDRVERILGFDVAPPQVSTPKLVFDEMDVRSPALQARLKGVDVLVHLAFIMDPIHDEATMRDVNVHGSQNVFKSAGEAGVPKIIYTSSATVYGAHPDNDFPLTEDSPLRANLDFSYPAHKLEVEYIVREFRKEFPRVRFVLFRPAIVFGPHVDNAWSRVLEAPVLVAVKGYAPPFQFVHEDDVAGALRFAVFENLDGPYNLGPPDWVEADRAEAILGRKRRELAEPTAWSVADRMWGLGLSEAPPGMLHYVMHPWVVSPSRLQDAGFTCAWSSEDTYRVVADRAKGYVRLGKARMSRSNMAKGAAAGLTLVGAAAAIRGTRRRPPA